MSVLVAFGALDDGSATPKLPSDRTLAARATRTSTSMPRKSHSVRTPGRCPRPSRSCTTRLSRRSLRSMVSAAIVEHRLTPPRSAHCVARTQRTAPAGGWLQPGKGAARSRVASGALAIGPAGGGYLDIDDSPLGSRSLQGVGLIAGLDQASRALVVLRALVIGPAFACAHLRLIGARIGCCDHVDHIRRLLTEVQPARQQVFDLGSHDD